MKSSMHHALMLAWGSFWFISLRLMGMGLVINFRHDPVIKAWGVETF